MENKKYYDIKLECLLPATLTYRIYAESPEKALELINRQNPTSVTTKIPAKKPIKIMVYEAGTTMMIYIKNFIKG